MIGGRYNSCFIRQRPIDSYIVDFYCSKHGLVVEVDCSHHYIDDYLEYDEIRTTIFEVLDLSILRFSNLEINNNIDSVCSKITDYILTKEKSPSLRGMSAPADRGSL
ncbi:MAG: endonuclease domain-containing protein [Candidatus Margulisbacteria bacterium]|nr:endonuclease domain-containing protein [Candidatus Margulisiibacteriota bacterium]